MATTDGEAQGLKRASKHPKSTTCGRQNPITERWNSKSQLVLWRRAWADIVNLHLEWVGSTEHVDHRSHAECGLDEQPTIHEGVTARAMEKNGVISDRCELNRQITTLAEKSKSFVPKKKTFCWISVVRMMLASRWCRAKSPPWRPAYRSWMSRRISIQLSWMKPCSSTSSCRVSQMQIQMKSAQCRHRCQ